jgi:hypothetical protein
MCLTPGLAPYFFFLNDDRHSPNVRRVDVWRLLNIFPTAATPSTLLFLDAMFQTDQEVVNKLDKNKNSRSTLIDGRYHEKKPES